MNSNYLEFLAAFGIGGAHPGGLTLTKQYLMHETFQESAIVLDAGCGTGQTSVYLKQNHSGNVIAIDNHPIMVEKAEKRFNDLNLDIEILEANIENLPFETNSFDVIICESVLSFTNIEKSLSEFSRVLKQNGILIAIEMTNEGGLIKEEKEKIKSFYGVSDVLTENQWLNQFKKANFKTATAKKVSTILDSAIEQEPTTDFYMSEDINIELYEVLDQHQKLNVKFQKKLGFRIYRGIR
ncbi:class I SAM-dependent methyltransferase [Cytobacillus sp. S13-E01]|uniref:class I SAM-dependent methyltransferase n=1 Tax=Cytobacillus sp. S13-E01 TaxID=3031326 RepID=UPI0023D8790E|nr:class I SAM-dependent methyltransferase [Cytobacillus sp. S13-E01]MDF0725660.1 class I SAM-dependent methyltransferase [Cytobacillus sp. S13-E01]